MVLHIYTIPICVNNLIFIKVYETFNYKKPKNKN